MGLFYTGEFQKGSQIGKLIVQRALLFDGGFKEFACFTDKPTMVAVYVVETHDELSKMLEKHLPEGYVLKTFNRAQKALDSFLSFHYAVPLVIVSMDVEDLNGLELMKKIKAELIMTEVILITQPSALDFTIQAMKSGAYDVIEKPVSQVEIVKKTEHALKEGVLRSKLHLENFGRDSGLFHRWQCLHELELKRRIDGHSLEGCELDLLFMEPVSKQTEAQVSPDFVLPTLLVAEDESGIRKALVKTLSRFYTVFEAENGQQALEIAEAHPELDLALLDVYMPKLSGNEILPQLKAKLPTVEVVMLTAFKDKQIAVDTLKSGAFDYLTKPYRFDLLMDTLGKALQSKRYRDAQARSQGFQLSLEKRFHLFQELCEKRLDTGKAVLFEDVYVFIPELQSESKDPKTVLSSPVRGQSLSEFLSSFENVSR